MNRFFFLLTANGSEWPLKRSIFPSCNVMKVAVRELVPGLGGELLGNWGEH